MARSIFRFGVGLLVFSLLWETIARSGAVPINLFPSISEVTAALAALIRSGELMKACALSVGRTIEGLAIASLLALVVGLAAALSDRVRAALGPTVDICRTLPPPALVPLLIFELGLNESVFTTIIVFSAVWPIYIAVLSGLGHTEPVPLATAASFGASPAWRLLHVRLPSAAPAIFTGIRIGLGLSLMATIASEMIAGSGGIGFLLFDTAFSLRIPEMYATLLAAGWIGILLNAALILLQYPLVHWHTLQTATN